MAWIKSHSELMTHPKVKKVARLLKLSVPTVIGHLHMLWWWCLTYAQDGVISDYDVEEIADAVMFDGAPEDFVNALIDCRLLDKDDSGIVSVHDWEEHCGKEFKKRENDAERKRTSRSKIKDVQRTSDGQTDDVQRPSSVRGEERRREEKRGEETHPYPPSGRVGMASENLFSGLSVLDDAGQAHDAVVGWLEERGYMCQREYLVEDMGDGKCGKIDVFAQKADRVLAIEIDRMTPRDKSVFKLRQVENAEKIILLRGGESHKFIGDVHVISIPQTGEEKPTSQPRENVTDKKAILALIADTFSPELGEKVKDWLKYKSERNENYKPKGIQSLLTEIKNNADRYGEPAVIGVMNSSMASNYKGIIWDKINNINGAARASPHKTALPQHDAFIPPPNAGQRTYDEAVAARDSKRAQNSLTIDVDAERRMLVG